MNLQGLVEFSRNSLENTAARQWLAVLLLGSVLACLRPADVAAQSLTSKGKKVLVVASYHQEYKWVEDIVSELRRDLADASLSVFYMDTKKHPQNAEDKAREAYALYQRLQPDAVIAIDDDAQEYFVVPYLRDKVSTPVIFCGVNDDAGKYGFPATNVSGVIEKKHYRESISFAQVVNPAVRRVGVLYKPSSSNTVNLAQLEKEKATFSAELLTPVAVNTLAEMRQAMMDLSGRVDALLLLNMTGIFDDQGGQMEGHDAISAAVGMTSLVTIGASDWEIKAGALCGVIKSGEEQGRLASEMLLSLWRGKPLKDLPLTWNNNGQRYLNLGTLKRLGLELRPLMIIGSKIVSGAY